MNKLKAKNTLYNDPMYDVVIDSRILEQHLKEKNQQIAKLQKQLADKKRDYIADNEESLMLAHLDDVELIDYLKYIFKTEKQALHYHKHANIIRTETFPFLTWEEFNEIGKINFYDKNHCYVEFFISRIEKPYMIRIINHGDSYNCWGIKDYDYTEENFYKAYDECVKLFKGEE